MIAVDIYGQCAQLDRIAEVCARYGVPLIEDAAEALGATWLDRPAGTWGRYGAYSFNGNKIITTGGGGMLVGPSEDMERARYLSAQARQPSAHYEHTEVGYNYRLSNLLAAVGRGQLDALPGMIEQRHATNRLYRAAFAGTPGLAVMPWDQRGRPNGWLTVIEVDPAVARPHEICAHLDSLDIEARPAWKPMQMQPVFAEFPCMGGSVRGAALRARGLSAQWDGDDQRRRGPSGRRHS